MDGKGRALDKVMIERLWRTVKYDDIYIRVYESTGKCYPGLTAFFHRYNTRKHLSRGMSRKNSIAVDSRCRAPREQQSPAGAIAAAQDHVVACSDDHAGGDDRAVSAVVFKGDALEVDRAAAGVVELHPLVVVV